MFSSLTSHILIALAILPSAFALAPPVTVDTPLVTLPLARRHALAGKNLVAGDQARVKQLKSGHFANVQGAQKRDGGNVGITNTAIAYTVPVSPLRAVIDPC